MRGVKLCRVELLSVVGLVLHTHAHRHTLTRAHAHTCLPSRGKAQERSQPGDGKGHRGRATAPRDWQRGEMCYYGI